VVSKRNMLKIVIGIKLMTYSVCLFFILIGYKANSFAPIITEGSKKTYVDPLPQALVPAILIIGLAATSMMLATCIKLYKKYGTFDISKIKELKG
jgi:multisubunit Na+/H+ antiporter MnhC subunit